ncbi:MAG: flagellar hook-basal body complex protein [Terracidiphilus sp.]|jgi:flagellar hook protein FlgE
MASFYIPLSGLNADSTALNTIANDLSNMNTTGFKTQTTNFSNLFSQQLGSSGSGDAIQLGEGVQVASNETSFTQGSSDTTGNSTDMELNGNGFFVLNDGASNVLTRAGDFSLAANGNLISSDGLNVMGYPAVKGVVNATAALTPINIPVGQVEAPSATTTFGMTATLDSAAAVGTSVPGQVEVYDSMGKSYEATVTYTKTGTNDWSYSVSLPDSLSAAPATASTVSDTVTPTTSTSGTNTISTFDFSSSNGALATVVSAGTTLSIGGTTVTVPAAGESLTLLQGQINAATLAAGGTGSEASLSGGVLTVAVPTGTPALAVAGTVGQTMASSMTNYNFGASGGSVGAVDPGTNLAITGETASGATATIALPDISTMNPQPVTVAAYAAALNTALGTAGIQNVQVTSTAGGQLSINGANVSTTGSVIQDPIASANANGTLTFDVNGNLVSPAADVSGISFSGLSDGASTMNMTWNILGSSGAPTISQVDTPSAVASTTQNGYSSGTYQSFTVGSNGTVTATYSNGQQQNVGQLALANVSNMQGLEDIGNSEYAATLASGTATVGTSGAAGLGTVTDGALEESNVNISSEFSNLIIAQRAFEASSKAVTTFDTITQETINMIH